MRVSRRALRSVPEAGALRAAGEAARRHGGRCGTRGDETRSRHHCRDRGPPGQPYPAFRQPRFSNAAVVVYFERGKYGPMIAASVPALLTLWGAWRQLRLAAMNLM